MFNFSFNMQYIPSPLTYITSLFTLFSFLFIEIRTDRYHPTKWTDMDIHLRHIITHHATPHRTLGVDIRPRHPITHHITWPGILRTDFTLTGTDQPTRAVPMTTGGGTVLPVDVTAPRMRLHPIDVTPLPRTLDIIPILALLAIIWRRPQI